MVPSDQIGEFFRNMVGRLLKREVRRADLLQTIAWVVIVLAACTVFFGNMRFGEQALAAGLEDDFYYYAQAARELAFFGTSTFDGIHLTNGYHPLWLAVLTVLEKLFGVGGLLHCSSSLPLAVSLQAVQVFLTLVIAHLVVRLAKLRWTPILSCCIQLLITSAALVLVRTGMEVGLTLALAFALLWFRLRPTFHRSGQCCLVYGFLGSLTVLSRLDSILLVGMLFAFDVVSITSGRNRWKYVAAFGFGLLPIAAYLAMNEWIFHTLLPISGTAKQLRMHHVPSLRAFDSFANQLFTPRVPVYMLCVLLTLGALVLAVKWIAEGRKSVLPVGVCLAALLFPLLHLLTIITLSDWNIWQWYVYAWLIGGVTGALVVSPSMTTQTSSLSFGGRTAYWICGAFLIIYAGFITYSTNPSHDFEYAAAVDISQFAKSHPGLYAMGDRSGAVGYLSPQPVIQLEGLMMDKAFLQNIREQRDLGDVLRQYGVRYYISTRRSPEVNGCYSVKEPWQAGPDSPAMYANICQEPVAVFQHSYFINDVFDLAAPDKAEDASPHVPRSM